jgi:hypothetical protein
MFAYNNFNIYRQVGEDWIIENTAKNIYKRLNDTIFQYDDFPVIEYVSRSPQGYWFYFTRTQYGENNSKYLIDSCSKLTNFSLTTRSYHDFAFDTAGTLYYTYSNSDDILCLTNLKSCGAEKIGALNQLSWKISTYRPNLQIDSKNNLYFSNGETVEIYKNGVRLDSFDFISKSNMAHDEAGYLFPTMYLDDSDNLYAVTKTFKILKKEGSKFSFDTSLADLMKAKNPKAMLQYPYQILSKNDKIKIMLLNSCILSIEGEIVHTITPPYLTNALMDNYFQSVSDMQISKDGSCYFTLTNCGARLFKYTP